MHDRTPSQIKHIFAHSPVAGASALPVPKVRQGMFHGYTLTQLCTPLRRLLAFPQLVQQGFIRMNADAAARGARGTPRSQGTRRTCGGGKLHHHRLLYQVACLTGLRANELRYLTLEYLDIEQGGLCLDRAWTKNRQDGFQPLPKPLLSALSAFAHSGEARRLYARAYQRRTARRLPPQDPLLVVPQSPSLMLDIDLRAAGIPKYTPEGKVDFHALRVAYVTFIFEGGATPPEARELARHRYPELTLGVYARTRTARLQALVNEVALTILPEAKCAPGVHREVREDRVLAPLQEEEAPWQQARHHVVLPSHKCLVIQQWIST